MDPMKQLTSFPDPDFCPKGCATVGAYKKSDKNVREILKEFADEKALRASEKKQPADAPKPQTEQMQDPKFTEKPPSSGYEYLPKLKPGSDGKVDWTPLKDMTGTRPPVHKYAISRYSLNEWQQHNQNVLNPDVLNEANSVFYNAKNAVATATGNGDKMLNENLRRLKQKAKDLFRWKVEVEKACKGITDETQNLEIDRQRLKGATRNLLVAESISRECLMLRATRYPTELTADLAETQLIKEMNMVDDIRKVMNDQLASIEEQLQMNKAAKQRIEYDFCDKDQAYKADCENISMNINSPTIMFKPGAVTFGQQSAIIEYWEFFCRETIREVEECRQKSLDLRGGLDATLITSGRKLRTQADVTDLAFAETVALNQELCSKLEIALKETLQSLADIDATIENLYTKIRQMDGIMKLAQTRIANRNINRKHGEVVRDIPHLGLIEEVKKTHETVSMLLGQLKAAERAKVNLNKKRTDVEKDIAAKRRTLNIDRDRCGFVRSFYPSAMELAGL